MSSHGSDSSTSLIVDLPKDVVAIDKISKSLQDQLLKLDVVVEQQSSGFVERNLLKISNATGHFGLIDLDGCLVECTSDGRLIANPHDSHNRSVQLAALPPRSLDDVPTCCAALCTRTSARRKRSRRQSETCWRFGRLWSSTNGTITQTYRPSALNASVNSQRLRLAVWMTIWIRHIMWNSGTIFGYHLNSLVLVTLTYS